MARIIRASSYNVVEAFEGKPQQSLDLGNTVRFVRSDDVILEVSVNKEDGSITLTKKGSGIHCEDMDIQPTGLNSIRIK